MTQHPKNTQNKDTQSHPHEFTKPTQTIIATTSRPQSQGRERNLVVRKNAELDTPQALDSSTTFPQDSQPSQSRPQLFDWAYFVSIVKSPWWKRKGVWAMIAILAISNVGLLVWEVFNPNTYAQREARIVIDVKQLSVGNPIFAVNRDQDQEIVYLLDEVEAPIEVGIGH